MPLEQGCSVWVCKKNYRMLINEGRPKNQAYAIMADIARKNSNKCSLDRRREILIERDFFGYKSILRRW